MQAAVMPEARRREYLAALGIPLFVARAPLPGAAASVIEPVAPEVVSERISATPAHALAAVPVRESVPLQTASAPRAPLPALAEAASLLQQTPRRPALTTPEAPVATPVSAVVSPAMAAEPAPSFTCRLVQVAPQLAVLLDLGAYPDLGAPERQLWQAICRALSWTPQQLAADFSWPLTASGKSAGMIGNGADAARAFVQGWLGRDLDGGDRLLLLGPALAPFVERPHRLLPSLAELLASPLAKRALWQQLAAGV